MKHIRVFSKPKTLSATCFVGIMFEKKLLQVGWFVLVGLVFLRENKIFGAGRARCCAADNAVRKRPT